MEERKKKVKSILVTLPKPENDKNPYAELAKKHNLKIDFRSFIHVEGVPAKDFRKEKDHPFRFFGGYLYEPELGRSFLPHLRGNAFRGAQI